jgi:hypothetical protein
VSEEKKERKPLLEALASVTDGLDVLVGLEKEKKEEKPAERKAPDTFGGILQSMIPLLIIPQILPLFQQSLGQTLQSTTVNVKVESATALIPISIEAATAIIPIEIRASQVTLNVNIVSQATELNVNIASQTTALNVVITGDTLVVIKSQQVGIYLADTWITGIIGQDIDLVGFSWLDPFASHTILYFEPPAGETYLLEAISIGYILPKDTMVRPELIVLRVYAGTQTTIDYLVGQLNITREKPTDFVNLLRTIKITSSKPLQVLATSYSSMRIGVTVTAYLYKVV